jgi:hypothetical protein
LLLKDQGSEPEGKSETDNAVAEGIADHIITDAGIAKADEGRLLAPGKTRVFNGGIDTLEVRVIEHVLERGFELQAGAFIQLDVFKQSQDLRRVSS